MTGSICQPRYQILILCSAQRGDQYDVSGQFLLDFFYRIHEVQCQITYFILNQRTMKFLLYTGCYINTHII